MGEEPARRQHVSFIPGREKQEAVREKATRWSYSS
jgi:hypothetical protein